MTSPTPRHARSPFAAFRAQRARENARDAIAQGIAAPAETELIRHADIEHAGLRAGVAAMRADTTTTDPHAWDRIFLAEVGIDSDSICGGAA